MSAPAGYAGTRQAAARTSAPRSRRPMLLLETATFMSGVGNGIASVALPWLILERTGSAAAAGVVAAATALPLLFTALLSGTVIDLVGRRRTAIASDLLSALSVLAIPLVDSLGGLTVATLAGLAVLGAVFDPAGAAARESMLPETAQRAGWTLDRANGVHETLFGLSFLIGPGVGGLLIATVGASGALIGTGIGFLVAAGCVALLRGLPGSGRPDHAERPDGIWRGTREGLSFVLHEPLLRPLAILIMLVVALYYPVEGVILPVYFQEIGSPGQLGVVLMAMSAGMVVGTLAYEPLVRRFTKRWLFVGSMLGSILALLGMAFLPPFGWLLVAAALTGMLWGPVQPLLNHAMQTRTPDRLRGRVNGTIASASMAAGPLGFLVVGGLVEALGPRDAFLTFAVGLVAVAVAMSPLKAWRLLDAEPVEGSAAAGHSPAPAATADAPGAR